MRATTISRLCNHAIAITALTMKEPTSSNWPHRQTLNILLVDFVHWLPGNAISYRSRDELRVITESLSSFAYIDWELNDRMHSLRQEKRKDKTFTNNRWWYYAVVLTSKLLMIATNPRLKKWGSKKPQITCRRHWVC